MRELFGIAALIIFVAANFPYAIDVIKGRADPHRISWFIWTLLAGVEIRKK